MEDPDLYTSEVWNLDDLVARSPRFHHVMRTPMSNCLETGIQWYANTGEPLIIEGLHNHPDWRHVIFNLDWFVEHGQKSIPVRHVKSRKDSELSIEHFVSHSRNAVRSQETEPPDLFYAKDAECPEAWHEWLDASGVVPASLLPYGPDDIFQNLPHSARVETLMCYLGVGGTLTPCHKDLCASSGQNIMMYTEDSASAFWFMTKSCDAPTVAEYFQSLRHELEQESYTITVDELARAPFDVFIAEQKLGDLVLVPPRSCHQVVNHGGMSVKMSWSRMTLRGAATALRHELPVYHRMCRKEVYRIKSTIHCTMLAITRTLRAQLSENGSLKFVEFVSTATSVALCLARI
ncbi:hypothetical protein OF83DRAFT_1052549 [Amylostereum chailletii]|nr:hypothetical protein OF83DRAFT_1052549 [Amylostereum chailletii]